MGNRGFVILLLFLSFGSHVWCQSSDRNYIQHRVFTDESGNSCQTEVSYYDGRGKPIQGLSNANSSKGIYGVTNTQYDELGRVKLEWLSTPMSSSCSYVSETEFSSSATSYYKDTKPFTQISYDALDRPLEKYLPGEDWYGKCKSVKYSYGSNSANQVRMFQAPLGSEKLEDSGFYAANTLTVETVTDEDDRAIETFKDVLGNKVLERRSGDNDTYYIYNAKGELRFILPQGYLDASDDEAYDCFAYEYRYDGNGLCVWKKMPGCDSTNMWYDDYQRLAYSQNGNQRMVGKCTYYLYDDLGRISSTGLCPVRYAGTGNIGEVTELCHIYYDDYSFVSSLCPSLTFKPKANYASSFSSAKGLQTGKVNYLLDGSGRCLCTVLYYDELGNVIQTQSTNHLSGVESTYLHYTFTNKVDRKLHEHTAEGRGTLTEEYTYVHDSHTDQLLQVSHQMNGGQVVELARYTYDDLGNMIGKKIGGQEQVSYGYNLRKWLSDIGSSHFKEILAYNVANGSLVPSHPLYGGNISAQSWCAGTEPIVRNYDFLYDQSSQLLSASYSEGNGGGSANNHYSTSYSYDSMGNMLTLERKGLLDNGDFGLIDKLNYEYDGNQVIKIDDAVSGPYYQGAFHFVDGSKKDVEYSYDANGNMIKDLNKGIANIAYNMLNLPTKVTFGENCGTNISYLYDSEGNMLKKTYESSSVNFSQPSLNDVATPSSMMSVKQVDYCGNVIYEDSKRMLLTEEGYITFSEDDKPKYHYYLKDHLGNNRVVLSQNGNTEQVNHYYPFGGLMGESTNDDMQRYKYNGKELERMYGLDWYEYGARMYDGVRFISQDAHKEKYLNSSPYCYCAGNPINSFDIDGNDWYKTEKNWLVWNPNVKSQSDLQEGYTYIGPFYYDSISDTSYRKDGTILFSNEKQAYQRMWYMSRTHWKSKKYPSGKEESAFLLNDGKVLLMADNWNDSMTSKMNGYMLNGNLLSNKTELFYVLGHVHTHPDKSFDQGMSIGDQYMVKAHPNIPFLILHANNNIYAGINKKGQLRGWVNDDYIEKVNNVLSGKTSLFDIIKFIKK